VEICCPNIRACIFQEAAQRQKVAQEVKNRPIRPPSTTLTAPGLPDWFIFEPKIPKWVNFGGPSNEKSWYILWPLEYITAIWNKLQPFGINYGHLVICVVALWYIFPVLVHCVK
jgi:hypothetical protein